MDKRHRLHKIAELFLVFLKIGTFTFGGGYAMIPLIHREMVENKSWITDEEIMDIIAIAESTPGPLAVNSATFVGFRIGGFEARAATAGVVLPAFVIICVLSLFIVQFKSFKLVSYAFEGIRAGVIVLIVGAVVKLAEASRHDALYLALMAAVFVIATFTGVSAIWLLIAGFGIGVLIKAAGVRRAKRSGEDTGV
ncbi:MAG: chromate transporter [Oscillospiraceae bacterium]